MTKSNQNNLRDLLALNHLYGLSSEDIACFIKNIESGKAILTSSKPSLKNAGFSRKLIEQIQRIDWSAVDRELQWAEISENHVVTVLDADYPKQLCEIKSPPLVLFVQGDINLLSQPQLAMVGSRNATPIGVETAEQFARYLTQCGLTITSGLALGIDAASHCGAIRSGKTIAVLGTGLDFIYPKRNQQLAIEIVKSGGAVISEFPLGTPPERKNFPRRNRIISGLSLGVLVVEATLYSGSLITARLAGEQGREIFAIPGSIHNPVARGCHQLIRCGAKLVETAQDIIEELAFKPNMNSPKIEAEQKFDAIKRPQTWM